MGTDGATLYSQLANILPADQILVGDAVTRAYDGDAYPIDRSRPVAIVLPTTTEEVAAVVRFCSTNGIPFTPRGAGTGLSGGAMPALGGVVISTKRMTKILEIDVKHRRLLAQAGIANLTLSHAVADAGLHFAPDPSSQSVSTLGGNIAENSGGPHTLKYGVTTQHILGVTLVTDTGEIQQIGNQVPGGPGSELLDLVIGSEGTLGIVTEAWVKLTPLPASTATALVAFLETQLATQSVSNILAAGVVPAALEMLDRNILVAVSAAFDIQFPPATEAMLLIECDGDESVAAQELAQAIEVCRGLGAIDIQIAKTSEERAQLWRARKKGIGAMGRLAPTIVTHDGVIPPSRLPEMLVTVYATAVEFGLGVANMFHAGDGNLHPIFYFDERIPGKVEAVIEAGEKIMRRCIELGGSVSGEHGIGVEKVDLLAAMFDTDSIELQRRVQRAFTSTEHCNPCKVIPHGKGCVEHMRRWRGAAT